MDEIQPLITSIPLKLSEINEILIKGPAISYFNALTLGRKSSDVCSTISKAVAIYEKGFTPTESEAEILLEAMTKIVELTESQLSLLVDTKPVFDKLWVAGLVKKDAASLGIASAKLSEIMIKVSPEQMKGQGQALEDRRKAAFGRVLAAYGNEEVVEGKEGEGVL
ncbi:hypothetical protein MFRU_042g00050 [Monilinia fructicola]|uniref:Uncharacterized protein n=1 Tax=Monilinia fructicola TaxID=38448 RepID=A0A5M9JAY0_MONFR|nr:hypothetical protein EYC84_009036 [Monilinia fructicola]KAG4026276.1 hypothetical protein MFRU_042g00050 [Monilinia fructicola]